MTNLTRRPNRSLRKREPGDLIARGRSDLERMRQEARAGVRRSGPADDSGHRDERISRSKEANPPAPTRKRVEWKELADYIGSDCDCYSSGWASDAWIRLTRWGLADYAADDERRIVVIRLITLASVWSSFAGRRNGGQGEPVEDLLSGMARADLLFLAGVRDIADLADIMDPVEHAEIAAEYEDVADVYILDTEDIMKPIVELIGTEYPKLVSALVRAFGDDETLLMSMEADHWTMCYDNEDMERLKSEYPEAAEVIEQALDKQGYLKYEDLFSCDSILSEVARKEVLRAIARLEGVWLDSEPSAQESCRLLYSDMDWHEHVRFPHFGS